MVVLYGYFHVTPTFAKHNTGCRIENYGVYGYILCKKKKCGLRLLYVPASLRSEVSYKIYKHA